MNLANSTTDVPVGLSTDFGKIRVGVKALDDAVINLGDYRKADPRLSNKEVILKAIASNDIDTMREVSNFFFRISGIYARLCKHLSHFYRYDWLLTPYVSGNKLTSEKVIEEFEKTLEYLDNFRAKQYLGETALQILINGCYYGYKVVDKTGVQIQELPPK